MKINSAGLELIKSFEGCKLEAYKDIVGVWTVGFGHTGNDVYEKQRISQEEAEELLKDDLCKFEAGVASLLKVKVSENQFSALVSFAYNLGLGNLKSSLLLRCINKNNVVGAEGEFKKWNHAGGKVVEGLTRRREAEAKLFSTG